MGLFGSKKKLDDGLKKTRNGFFGNILNMMGASEIDDDLYEELEEQLILADTGADMASKLVDELSAEVKHKHLKTGPQALEALEGLIEKELTPDSEFDLSGKPAVILVIGVNGVGKTTSIAKLANLYKSQGKRVMLAAGDTFRAAAAEQLSVWADRAGVPLVKAGGQRLPLVGRDHSEQPVGPDRLPDVLHGIGGGRSVSGHLWPAGAD